MFGWWKPKAVAPAREKAAPVDDVIAEAVAPLGQQPDLKQHSEQVRHFEGHAYSAIRLIAQRIAGQELHVGRVRRVRAKKSAHEEIDHLPDHEIHSLFAQPSGLATRWQLMYTMAACLELTGRAFIWITEGDAGQPILFPVPPHWIQRGDVQGGAYVRWWCRPPGMVEEFAIDAAQMIYISYPDPSDPLKAISPLQAQAKAITTDESIQTSQYRGFQNGITPKVLISTKIPSSDKRPKLTSAQRRQVEEAMRRLQGADQAGGWCLLDALIDDIKPFSFLKNSEMDYLESGEFVKDRIMECFGVPDILLGQHENANRASAYVAEDNFYQCTINPKLLLVSECLTRTFSAIYDDPDLRVWLEPCVARDPEMRLKRMEAGLRGGAVLVNEWREFCGLPPDPNGNIYLRAPTMLEVPFGGVEK